MFQNKIITFIGPGMMAEAMIYGLLRCNVTTKENLIAAGPREERLKQLNSHYGIKGFIDNAEAAKQADIIVFSVKPQSLDHVLESIRGSVKHDALILSIVAGATIGKICKELGHDKVVRCMPNTPAQIGEGVTVWTSSPAVSQSQKKMAREILSALGEEILVEEERYLDMATALSGTGPAYVYLFMEAMVDAGVHLGFPRRIAEKLVAHTVRGSVDYFQKREDPVHLARLRNEVTSPGGTSAAALYYLEKAGFRTAISRAIWAAYERSQELGRGKERQSPESPGEQ